MFRIKGGEMVRFVAVGRPWLTTFRLVPKLRRQREKKSWFMIGFLTCDQCSSILLVTWWSKFGRSTTGMDLWQLPYPGGSCDHFPISKVNGGNRASLKDHLATAVIDWTTVAKRQYNWGVAHFTIVLLSCGNIAVVGQGSPAVSRNYSFEGCIRNLTLISSRLKFAVQYLPFWNLPLPRIKKNEIK